MTCQGPFFWGEVNFVICKIFLEGFFWGKKFLWGGVKKIFRSNFFWAKIYSVLKKIVWPDRGGKRGEKEGREDGEGSLTPL